MRAHVHSNCIVVSEPFLTICISLEPACNSDSNHTRFVKNGSETTEFEVNEAIAIVSTKMHSVETNAIARLNNHDHACHVSGYKNPLGIIKTKNYCSPMYSVLIKGESTSTQFIFLCRWSAALRWSWWFNFDWLEILYYSWLNFGKSDVVWTTMWAMLIWLSLRSLKGKVLVHTIYWVSWVWVWVWVIADIVQGPSPPRGGNSNCRSTCRLSSGIRGFRVFVLPRRRPRHYKNPKTPNALATPRLGEIVSYIVPWIRGIVTSYY